MAGRRRDIPPRRSILGCRAPRVGPSEATKPHSSPIRVVPLDPLASDRARGVEPLAAALADRYRAERELGSGGMATVYLADDVSGPSPSTGGAPRQLVRFDDPRRPSYRQEWTIGGNRIFFPVEDRQADVWVMDVTTR